MKKLSKDLFASIIEHTPLISIDFVIKNPAGDYLLGRRKNAPAAGYWFNLGGRIYKDETTHAALGRIFRDETGLPLDRNTLKFLGVFDHIYDDNVFLIPGFGTHYVNMAYAAEVTNDQLPKTMAQHGQYKWWSRSALLASDTVHENTKISFVD